MSDQPDSLCNEQLTSLVTAGNIVIQFDESHHRVAVGLPFAAEYSGGNWWLCCPQGKFKLCIDAPVLFGRIGVTASLRWMSILESFRGFLMFRDDNSNLEDTPVPSEIPHHHADWLLDFVRHCALVVVSDDPQIPAMPPESRAMVATKHGVALSKIKQLIRRRGARRFQPRR